MSGEEDTTIEPSSSNFTTNNVLYQNDILQKLCRICGSLHSERNQKFYAVSKHDVSELHPCQFCQKCFYHLKNYKARKIVSSTIPIKWGDHKNSNCETCVLCGKNLLGEGHVRPPILEEDQNLLKQ